MTHITRTWVHITQLWPWKTDFLYSEKQPFTILQKQQSLSKLIEKKKNPSFPNDTEGKVWRKSTKIWMIVHVETFLSISSLTVRVDMYS